MFSSNRFAAICLVATLSLFGGSALAGDPPAAFTEEAAARGVVFALGPFPQSQGYLGQGGGFVDLDSDGDPDIVLIGALGGRIGLFENIGGGMFVDRSLGSGIPFLSEQDGFAAADYDADGLLDLYLTQHTEPNLLMRNLGGFIFENVTSTAGVGDPGAGTGPTWGDYDSDGWLDLYVSNYNFENPPVLLNLLYHNNGNGTFTDQAAVHGVDSAGLSFQTVWTDYDKDGDVDLYLSNDRGPVGYTPNQLWRNDNGLLVDVSAASNADVSLFSMGLAAGDFDGNLYPDYYTTNIATEPPPFTSHPGEGINPLLLNLGDGTFVEAAEAAGVANFTTSWGAIFFDFDNNGHKDLYVNNMWKPNSFFNNNGTFPCPEIANLLQIEATYDPGYDPANPPPSIASFSSAIADVDGDGDLDLLVNNLGSMAQLFINHEGSKRNYVRYNVVGEHPNLFAVGVSIETTAGDRVHWDENYAGGNGYLGQNELVLHVGLDDTEIVDQALVRWPSGGPTRTLTNLPANEEWTIYPPSRLCDFDGGGAVDNADFQVFAGCFASGFEPGCEMMDFDGNSSIYVDDLEDCFVGSPTDCNGNGTEDLVEILLDLGLDGDDDGAIDCCSGGPTPFPNQVGSTLVLRKDGSGNPDLGWTPPAADASHDAATSYDILVSTTHPTGTFGLVANVSSMSHTDLTSAPTGIHFYLVVSRNSCGSSGEEPF